MVFVTDGFQLGYHFRSVSNKILFYHGMGLQNSVTQDPTGDLFQGDFLKFDL